MNRLQYLGVATELDDVIGLGLEGEFCVPGHVVVVAAFPSACRLARNAFSCSIPFLARIISDSSVSSGVSSPGCSRW